MTAENFAYWLQGFNEIQQMPPTPEQWKVIQDHLKLVFNKVTPERIIGSGQPTYCSDASLKVDGLPHQPPGPYGSFPRSRTIFDGAGNMRDIPATSC